MATPADIRVGGVRAPILRENLLTARTGMPGGLVERGWLPDVFVLINADFIGDFIEVANQIQSVDLAYDGVTNYLHIWQSYASPDELGENDPVTKGEPIEGTEWNANPLPVAQVGRPGVVEFSTRLVDVVDSEHDATDAQRVHRSTG